MVLTLLSACSKVEEDVSQEVSDYDKIAIKIGDMEYTVNDYNYTYVSAFSDVYNYYGSYIDMKTPLSEQDMGDGTTWHEYFCSYTEDTLKSLTALYEKAKAEGFELSESAKESLSTLHEDIEASAEEYGMDFDKYVEAMYGKGMTYDCIAKMMEIGTLASEYANSYGDAIEVSSDEIKAYYEENKSAYDTVTFRYYSNYYYDGETEVTDEQVAEYKATAEDIATAKNPDEFIAKVVEHAPEDKKEYYKEDSATLMKNATNDVIGIEELSAWLYDSARVNGETFVYEDEGYGFITVMFESSDSADYDCVNVRHILVKPVADEDGIIPESAWKDAEKKAKEIYDGYLTGETTEDAFAELVNEYSEDPGSASNGGLYTDVYKGQMVAEFNDWCFDEARAVGDTDIVKTTYGYHIMYFSGKGISNLERALKSNVVNAKFEEWFDELTKDYTVEDGEGKALADGSVIIDIVTAADEYAAAKEAENEALEEAETPAEGDSADNISETEEPSEEEIAETEAPEKESEE